MYKLLCSILLSIAGGLCYARVSIDSIEEAIAQSRLGRLKGLLHRLDAEDMTEYKRRKLYYDFYDAACEQVDEKKDALSLYGSWKDIAQTVSGTVLTLAGAVVGGIGVLQSLDPALANTSFLLKAGGSCVSIAGLYLFYRGVTCSTQQRWIKDAQDVELFIEDKVNKIDGSDNSDDEKRE